MRAELLTIGNEILIGQITNTNAVWMAQQLNLIGVNVVHMSSVSDDYNAILNAMEGARKRSDIVLLTGGLGPTKDDITKKTFCDYFETDLVLDEMVLKDVTEFFHRRNKTVSEINQRQAEVPRGCKVLFNKLGTAPGLWMEKDNTIFISMPGVPYEMQGIMNNWVLPALKTRFTLPFIYHKTILTQGIGESLLAELISDWEDKLAVNNISLAYLPSPGMVRLRLSCQGENESEIKNIVHQEIEKVKPLIEKFIYGYEEYGSEPPKLEEILGQLLLEKGLKLALAESCTGGYISHLITSVSGSSSYFNGCVVPYHNEFKQNILNVDVSIFENHGAVSQQCVSVMASETMRLFHADVAIAVSGIAGPSGGTADKPVGSVWIAVAYRDKTVQKYFLFGDNRQRNIQLTAVNAMNMLRKLILGIAD